MKKLILLLLFVTYSISAQNIATIDITYILKNNLQYINFIEILNIKKKEIEEFINLDKDILENLNIDIENNKMILNSESLNQQITEFNDKLQLLNKKLDNLNNYMNQNIIFNEKIIIKSIAELVTTYSNNNNIDLVINENNYFIANKDIDISEIILKDLSKINIIFIVLNESEYFEN